MDRDGPAFRYLSEKVYTLSEAKIKEGIFIGPQIRELLKDIQFDSIIHYWKRESSMEGSPTGCNKVSWKL